MGPGARNPHKRTKNVEQLLFFFIFFGRGGIIGCPFRHNKLSWRHTRLSWGILRKCALKGPGTNSGPQAIEAFGQSPLKEALANVCILSPRTPVGFSLFFDLL